MARNLFSYNRGTEDLDDSLPNLQKLDPTEYANMESNDQNVNEAAGAIAADIEILNTSIDALECVGDALTEHQMKLDAIEKGDTGTFGQDEEGGLYMDTPDEVNVSETRTLGDGESGTINMDNPNAFSVECFKIQKAISNATGVLGMDRRISKEITAPGMESVNRNSLDAYRGAVEGLGDFFKKIKDAIVNFFKMIWNKLKQFWNWLFGKGEAANAKADEAIVALKQKEEEAQEQGVNVEETKKETIEKVVQYDGNTVGPAEAPKGNSSEPESEGSVKADVGDLITVVSQDIRLRAPGNLAAIINSINTRCSKATDYLKQLAMNAEGSKGKDVLSEIASFGEEARKNALSGLSSAKASAEKDIGIEFNPSELSGTLGSSSEGKSLSDFHMALGCKKRGFIVACKSDNSTEILHGSFSGFKISDSKKLEARSHEAFNNVKNGNGMKKLKEANRNIKPAIKGLENSQNKLIAEIDAVSKKIEENPTLSGELKSGLTAIFKVLSKDAKLSLDVSMMSADTSGIDGAGKLATAMASALNAKMKNKE